MTALELLDLFSLPCNKKLHLKDYEKEMILQRAKEYKIDGEELEVLKRGIIKDKFVVNKNNIYNLLTGESFSIRDICKLHKTNNSAVKYKLENKICINDVPYSYNKEDMPYFYKISPVKKSYFCVELNATKTREEWKKYFNDDNIQLTFYATKNYKYKSKYSFKIKEIKYFCEL